MMSGQKLSLSDRCTTSVVHDAISKMTDVDKENGEMQFLFAIDARVGFRASRPYGLVLRAYQQCASCEHLA